MSSRAGDEFSARSGSGFYEEEDRGLPPACELGKKAKFFASNIHRRPGGMLLQTPVLKPSEWSAQKTRRRPFIKLSRNALQKI